MSTITQVPQDRLLSVKEAADLVGLSAVTLYRRLEAGALPCIRLGDGPKAPIRISSADLATYIAERYGTA
jgi:excisionase family DNA binding protein